MPPWTYYWDYDRDRLLKDETVWTNWLSGRIEKHALTGLKTILARMKGGEGGWVLIYAHALFGAVEGLSSFAYETGSDGNKFRDFCDEYFLPKPPLFADLSSAMYGNFRCGLAHGFGIEHGGLTFKVDLGSSSPVTKSGDSYWLDPAWLLERLEAASAEFLRRAVVSGSVEEAAFRKRFRRILDNTSLQPPRKTI